MKHLPLLFLMVIGMVLSLTRLQVIAGRVTAYAQERVDLSVAEVKTTTAYRLKTFHAEFDDPATAGVDEGGLQITLVGTNGEQVGCSYAAVTTPTATFLNNGLNKANLSSAYVGNATTGSLKQRIYHRLVVMNEAPAVCGRALVGSLAGTVP